MSGHLHILNVGMCTVKLHYVIDISVAELVRKKLVFVLKQLWTILFWNYGRNLAFVTYRRNWMKSKFVFGIMKKGTRAVKGS